MLYHHIMTDEEKKAVCEWKYQGEYAIYNSGSYEEQRAKSAGFFNPKNRFFSFLDGEKLVGFINLFEEEEEVFFGIGVEPESVSKGYGRRMAREARAISHRLFPKKPLYLEVRAWNERAIACYRAAGFRIDGEAFCMTTPIGEGEFYRMIEDDTK